MRWTVSFLTRWDQKQNETGRCKLDKKLWLTLLAFVLLLLRFLTITLRYLLFCQGLESCKRAIGLSLCFSFFLHSYEKSFFTTIKSYEPNLVFSVIIMIASVIFCRSLVKVTFENNRQSNRKEKNDRIIDTFSKRKRTDLRSPSLFHFLLLFTSSHE